ncbi:MAG: mechanosensitive ion channel family protein, partial [Gemmatimonadaceae bacterium]
MDFLDRLRASFADLGRLIPALLGALIIIFAGYLLAKLLEKGIDRSLAKVGLNRWLERGGVMDAVAKTG